LSFAFFIPEDQEEPLSLTHVLSLSVIEVLEKFGIRGKIKWPNDVMVGGKKMAGILCETVHLPPHFGVVMGLGLNVNMPLETLQRVGQPATSILDQMGQQVDTIAVKEAVVRSFSHNLELFLQKGFAPFQDEFRTHILPKT
jgi:BirA family biotin operon repressor/biotin-[acetyl-CoA-carboxylase] ligase